MGGSIGDRVRSIRELRGEKQPEYATALNAAAKRLKLPKNYSVSTISRLETGRQEITLEDVLIIAAVDPEKRGRDWLAWGDSAVSVAEPRARTTQTASGAAPYYGEPGGTLSEAHKPAAKKAGGGGPKRA